MRNSNQMFSQLNAQYYQVLVSLKSFFYVLNKLNVCNSFFLDIKLKPKKARELYHVKLHLQFRMFCFFMRIKGIYHKMSFTFNVPNCKKLFN